MAESGVTPMMSDSPVQRLHAADGAAEHEAETADAERIE
jgi:hypothetical protein